MNGYSFEEIAEVIEFVRTKHIAADVATAMSLRAIAMMMFNKAIQEAERKR